MVTFPDGNGSRQEARLYSDLAGWWPLLSAPADYEEEAAIYSDLLEEACDGSLDRLLELGCGGGNNASHMKHRFRDLVLTDVSAPMLAISRDLNPDCRHHQGDMRSLRLGETFDAVFVHDAVCYITSVADLRRVVETVWVHCRPGGAVLLAPDFVRESFQQHHEDGGHDEGSVAGGDSPRGLRYLSWAWDPDPSDTSYVVDYAYLLRERDGSVRVVHDRHEEGLFPRNTWLSLLQEVGFEARSVPLEHSETEPGLHEMFVGRRPG